MKKEIRYEENYNALFRFLMFITFLVGLFISCSTVKKTPEQKAYEANQKYISLLRDARIAFPCDTSTVYITKTDTAYIAIQADTTNKDGVRYITQDRIITKTITKQVTIIDSAALQEQRLATDQVSYLYGKSQEYNTELSNKLNKKDQTIKQLSEKINSLSPWKHWVIVGLCALVAFGLTFLFIKIKSFFI